MVHSLAGRAAVCGSLNPPALPASEFRLHVAQMRKMFGIKPGLMREYTSGLQPLVDWPVGPIGRIIPMSAPARSFP
jgi:hypothetical protein